MIRHEGLEPLHPGIFKIYYNAAIIAMAEFTTFA